MYSRILVPLDGSPLAEQVLPYIRIIGQGLQARIALFHAFFPAPPEATGLPYGAPSPQITAYLERTAESLRKDGLQVSFTMHEGNPASGIVREAESVPATLIAMSTHGRSGLTRWLLGSITDKVLHATASPLLIIRPQAQDIGAHAGAALPEVKLNTIIVPLDESAVAEQVLPDLPHLANALGLKVLLLRVTPSAEDYYRYMEYPIGPYQELPEVADQQAIDYLHEVGQRLLQQGILSVEERLLHGDPAGAIVDLARETPDSLVAMTTHGRSGVGRWILGSVTDRVVRHCGEPVLVIRAVAETPVEERPG